jgi:heme-degrading monooxygenase HmoA
MSRKRGDETLYARLVTGSIASDKLDQAIRLWRDSVAPSVRQQKGFKSARLLVERKTGKIASLGLWETEADVQGTVEWNQGQIAKFAGMFSAPPLVEHYEVVAEV